MPISEIHFSCVRTSNEIATDEGKNTVSRFEHLAADEDGVTRKFISACHCCERLQFLILVAPRSSTRETNTPPDKQ